MTGESVKHHRDVSSVAPVSFLAESVGIGCGSVLMAASTPGSLLPPGSSLIAADTNRKWAAGKMGHLDSTVGARIPAWHGKPMEDLQK